MTDPALPSPAGLPPGAHDELARAVAVLEGSSLPIRLATLVGNSVEALKRNLPGPVQRGLDGAVRRALEAALRAAMRSRPERAIGPLPQEWTHRGLIAAAGVAGGAFGFAGTLVELPVSTTLLLRQIGAIAAEQGEDLSDPAVQAECMKVFALGGRDPVAEEDAGVESGYFALRLALADALQAAAGRGFGRMLPGFLSAIAGRFGVPVALKVSAQMAPLVGAATGAAVNLAFLEHFRAVAEAHFTVRRLERAHGAALVRAAYDSMRDARMAA